MEIRENKYHFFTPNEIKPSGWLLEQLKIQAEGLSGHLDIIWPDIRNSKWIGGDKEGWERVPYWLDGFIPLAYLLRDEDLIRRAKKYIDAIISNQSEDGWICPCSDAKRHHYDVWAVFLICKVLVLYADCTKDTRIEEVVYSTLHNLYQHLHYHTLFNWGAARWFECLIPIYWLWERRQEDWLIDLTYLLQVQGFNYKELFNNWRAQEPKNKWSYTTHVVNLAMALKSIPLIAKLRNEDGNEFAKKMHKLLLKHHGTAIGHFTGDECLSGDSPIQGTELCAIVEAMYSFEQLFAITGDNYWIDCLEEHAYNSLPATISPDMWAHQYDQMVNQISCTKFTGKPIFRTNGPEAHLFGLEPNYGCCTANFNQGWPKLALSTFMKTDNTIISVVLAPSILETEINGKKVTIELKTMYPFRNKLEYLITTESEVDFTFQIRIPRFIHKATINTQNVPVGSIYSINKTWKNRETITVMFEYKLELIERPYDMAVLRRGPLFYAVKIEEEWTRIEYTKNGVERKYPYCDYEIRPLSKWNYAFPKDVLDTIQVIENDDYDKPFSSTKPPIYITCDLIEIDWGLETGYDNVCARVPNKRIPLSEPYSVKMFPYGATNLRITELPIIK